MKTKTDTETPDQGSVSSPCYPSARDYFAGVAMSALLQGAMKFDENGRTKADAEMDGDSTYSTMFADATCMGWGSESGILQDGEKVSYAEAIASDAYYLADAMMRERSKPQHG